MPPAPKPAKLVRFKPPDLRPSSHKRGYNRQWQVASSAFLVDHPLCEHCRTAGRLTSATCVDHIKPHKGDPALFWDRTNWQALCTSCHGIKTARYDGAFGRQPTEKQL